MYEQIMSDLELVTPPIKPKAGKSVGPPIRIYRIPVAAKGTGAK